MKNPQAVLSVKFNSTHDTEKLLAICNEDLQAFRDVPGLMQKYYNADPETGAICGFYLFDTAASRETFWGSDLAAGFPARYGVVPESLRVEKFDVAIVLNEYTKASA